MPSPVPSPSLPRFSAAGGSRFPLLSYRIARKQQKCPTDGQADRHSLGDWPENFLNARLNAASNRSRPPGPRRRPSRLSRQALGRKLHAPSGEILDRRIADQLGELSASAEREAPASAASSSSVQAAAGCACNSASARPTNGSRKPGEPAGVSRAELVHMAADRLDEHQFGKLVENALRAGALVARLARRQADECDRAAHRSLADVPRPMRMKRGSASSSGLNGRTSQVKKPQIRCASLGPSPPVVMLERQAAVVLRTPVGIAGPARRACPARSTPHAARRAG